MQQQQHTCAALFALPTIGSVVHRIYISSNRQKIEKEYLIENYFGTYTDPK
jgi:hypothetical protein